MSKIACLGWGSLIWDQRELPVDEWTSDGPLVKVEFVRHSQVRDYLTLVLYEKADLIQSHWAVMKTSCKPNASQGKLWVEFSGSAHFPLYKKTKKFLKVLKQTDAITYMPMSTATPLF